MDSKESVWVLPIAKKKCIMPKSNWVLGGGGTGSEKRGRKVSHFAAVHSFSTANKNMEKKFNIISIYRYACNNFFTFVLKMMEEFFAALLFATLLFPTSLFSMILYLY